MPNRGANQDQHQTGRRNPIQTTEDDDEVQAGDVTQMEEAGNKLRPRTSQEAAATRETEVEGDEAEGDEDEEDGEEEAEDDAPIGGRV